MSKVKPSLPKGTRDFLPAVMAKRQYIFDTIKKVYKKFGFEPIETPTFEKLETLTGKYGDEGDQLIFKIVNSGDYLKKAPQDLLDSKNSKALLPKISEKALRYDLTVPFARFVVQHQNDITFPFKRYQIQPVWRADRPQKGRYREFYQCDADVVGSDSLMLEADFIQIFDEALSNLGIENFSIKINNRKILSGIAEIIGKPEQIIPLTVAIDKLDKIGKDKVLEELVQRGFESSDLQKIDGLFHLEGSNENKIDYLKTLLSSSQIGLRGIEELEEVFGIVNALGLRKAKLDLDVTLARGLNYYTGAIFEVVANDVNIGSICGGGRYDDLTSIFGLNDISGIGISFGADRIYDVMEELNLFPKEKLDRTQVLFINFGKEEEKVCLKHVKLLRDNGISSEVYPEVAKMKKQMKYADQKQIVFVAMLGTKEIENNMVSIKNMETGHQEDVKVEDLVAYIKK